MILYRFDFCAVVNCEVVVCSDNDIAVSRLDFDIITCRRAYKYGLGAGYCNFFTNGSAFNLDIGTGDVNLYIIPIVGYRCGHCPVDNPGVVNVNGAFLGTLDFAFGNDFAATAVSNGAFGDVECDLGAIPRRGNCQAVRASPAKGGQSDFLRADRA